MKDAKAAPSGDDALGDDAADHRAVHSRLEGGDRGDGTRVLVAMGNVVQQVAGGDHPDATEGLGAYRPHPLQVRDAGVEIEALLRRWMRLRHPEAPVNR